MAKKEEYDFSEYADMKLPPKKEIKEPLAEEFDFSEYADNKNEMTNLVTSNLKKKVYCIFLLFGV